MSENPRPEWAVRLRSEREARGWGKHRMARELMRADGLERGSVANLSRQILDWEKGLHFPRDYRDAYATAFGLDRDALFPDGHNPQDQPIAPTGTVKASPLPEGEDDDVRRRAALQILAALGAGTTIPPGAVDDVLSGVNRALGQAVDVDEWERAVREYGLLVNQTPIGTLIGDLAADVVAVGELLDRAAAGTERAGLLRVGGALGALLAMEFGEVGNRRAARLAWGTARRAADASGDRDLRVWVRAREAQEGFWAGLAPGDIDALTGQAVSIANGVPCSGLPRAYAVRASLAAERGDMRGARATMDTLSAVFERLPDRVKEDPTSFGWSEARLRWNEAYVFTLIGDSRANRSVSDSLTLYPSGTLGPVANLKIINAMGLVRGREIDAGLDDALTTLHDLPISQARRRITGQILRMLPSQARTHEAAREMHAMAVGV